MADNATPSSKSKVKSKSSPEFVSTGGGHMSGKNSAGPQVPGQSASMGRGGGRFAAGGKHGMAGKQTSKNATPA